MGDALSAEQVDVAQLVTTDEPSPTTFALVKSSVPWDGERRDYWHEQVARPAGTLFYLTDPDGNRLAPDFVCILDGRDALAEMPNGSRLIRADDGAVMSTRAPALSVSGGLD
jgi:hypothetical protein